jgi:hypothetical protein
MRVFQGIFAIGLGLVAGAVTAAIAGQNSSAMQYACMALIGGVLVGVSLPGILSALKTA